MKKEFSLKLFGIFAAATLLFVLAADVFAQGRGRGNSGNSGAGRGNSGNTGVGRGNSDIRGGNRNDDIFRSRRDDDNRRRGNDQRTNNTRRKNNSNADNLNRYTGLSKQTGMPAEELRDWYQNERKLNPDLTFGQFVAANMIAKNRGSRFPQLTTTAIFSGLRDGKNLGRTLKDLGLRGDDFDREKKRVKREFAKFKKESGDNDLDLNW